MLELFPRAWAVYAAALLLVVVMPVHRCEPGLSTLLARRSDLAATVWASAVNAQTLERGIGGTGILPPGMKDDLTSRPRTDGGSAL